MTAPHAKFVDRAAGLRASSRRRRLLAGAGILLAAGLVWLVCFSSVLSVRSVQVQGGSTDLADQIKGLSRSTVGRPLARVDVAAVRRAVAGLGPVAEVQVRRSFPSTLVVQVEARTPVMVVQEPGGARRFVDGDGVAYARSGSSAGLPVVPVAEAVTSASTPQLRALVTVLAALDADQRRQVGQLQADKSGWVTFRTGGVQVRWGDSSAAAQKASALRTMLPVAAAQKATALDISTPGRPVLS